MLGKEGAGLRWRGRGRCPEVGAGRGFPRAAGSEVSAGAGSGCGSGRRGRGAGCGFSVAGDGGVGPGGQERGAEGGPWRSVDLAVCDAVV